MKGPLPVTSGADYPEVRTSNIDVDHVPVYKPAGKSLTEVDIDEGMVSVYAMNCGVIGLTQSRSEGS